MNRQLLVIDAECMFSWQSTPAKPTALRNKAVGSKVVVLSELHAFSGEKLLPPDGTPFAATICTELLGKTPGSSWLTGPLI